VMVGDGPDRGAAEWIAKQRGVQKDVLFLGKQDRISELLAQADIFLMPSELESFGLAALEAMACEVPVIATNVGGVPEVVTHGVDGFLVSVGDVAAAAGFAIELLSTPGRVREMGRTARVNARKRYCSNDVIPRYEAYYRSVLERAS